MLNAVPSGKILTLGPGIFDIGSDFDDNGLNALFVPPNVGGIWGSGKDSTILQMTPNSSTKLASTQGLADFDSNPCQLVRFGHSAVLHNLQVKGTDQGHPYNGVTWYPSAGGGNFISGVVVDGCKFVNAGPGYANFPPGETFQLDLNWCLNSQVTNTELDGLGLSGANLGYNNCTSSYVADVYSHDSGASHGITWWRCRNVTTLRVICKNNGRGNLKGDSAQQITFGVGLNHEHVDGTVAHDSPTIFVGPNNKAPHLRFINNDGTHTAPQSYSVTNVTNDDPPWWNNPGQLVVLVDDWGEPAERTTTPPSITKAGQTLVARLDTTGQAMSPATNYVLLTSW